MTASTTTLTITRKLGESIWLEGWGLLTLLETDGRKVWCRRRWEEGDVEHEAHFFLTHRPRYCGQACVRLGRDVRETRLSVVVKAPAWMKVLREELL